MKRTTLFELPEWENLAEAVNAGEARRRHLAQSEAVNVGEARRKYLAQCSAFELTVRKLIKHHEQDIKRAKEHLGNYPKRQHWHFSCRMAKQTIRENKFYIRILKNLLPCRKSVWTELKEFFRKWYL